MACLQTSIYGGVMLQSCLNTTIQGPGYFYYPVANQGSTQGNITAVYNNGMAWNITVCQGPNIDVTTCVFKRQALFIAFATRCLQM